MHTPFRDARKAHETAAPPTGRRRSVCSGYGASPIIYGPAFVYFDCQGQDSPYPPPSIIKSAGKSGGLSASLIIAQYSTIAREKRTYPLIFVTKRSSSLFPAENGCIFVLFTQDQIAKKAPRTGRPQLVKNVLLASALFAKLSKSGEIGTIFPTFGRLRAGDPLRSTRSGEP